MYVGIYNFCSSGFIPPADGCRVVPFISCLCECIFRCILRVFLVYIECACVLLQYTCTYPAQYERVPVRDIGFNSLYKSHPRRVGGRIVADNRSFHGQYGYNNIRQQIQRDYSIYKLYSRLYRRGLLTYTTTTPRPR